MTIIDSDVFGWRNKFLLLFKQLEVQFVNTWRFELILKIANFLQVYNLHFFYEQQFILYNKLNSQWINTGCCLASLTT